MTEIDTLIILIIIALCSVLALVAIGRGLHNLSRERSNLENGLKKLMEALEQDRRDRKLEDGYEVLDKYRKDKSIDSSKALQQLIKEAHLDIRKKNECTLRTSYASERLYAIINSVNTANEVRKTPPLNDLHKLTVQREQSGICPGIFRAITPSILVMGILGTLWGVHERLEQLQGNPGLLKEALLPGAWAVAATILLLVLRYIYTYKLSQFLKEFDSYTISHILPFFHQPDVAKTDRQAYITALKNTLTGENKFDTKKLTKTLKDWDQHMSSMLESMKKLRKDLGTKIKETFSCRHELFKAHAELEQQQLKLNNNIQLIRVALRLYAKHREEALESQYSALEALPALVDTLRALLDRESEIQQLHESMKSIREGIDKLQLQEAYSDIEKTFRLTHALYRQIQNTPEEIKQIDQYKKNLQEYAVVTKEQRDIICHDWKSEYDQAVVAFLKHSGANITKFKEQAKEVNEQAQVLREKINTLVKDSPFSKDLAIKGDIYPPGWLGVLMKLHDRLDKIREFIYKDKWGRIISGVSFILIIIFLRYYHKEA